MKKFLYGCFAICLLSGCGLFKKAPLDVDGQRISVIREDKNIQPDYAAGQVKIKLPVTHINDTWAHNGGTSMHLNGHLKATGDLDEIWSASFGKGTSKRNHLLASPVAANNIVYTLDAEGIVKAFRIDNGKKIWKKRLKHANKNLKDNSLSGGGLAVHDGVVYATSGLGKVFALNAESGDTVWELDLRSPIRIAPTVNDDLVIVQTLDNGIFAIKTASGDILWKDKIETEGTTMIGGAAPAYSPENDLVVAAFSNGQIQAYKASTGSLLWSEWIVSAASTESISDITSIKANPVIYVVGYNAPLAAIDIRTGVKLWQKEIASSSQPWVAGQILFVLTNDGDIAALDKTTGNVIWSAIVPSTHDADKSGVFATGPLLANDSLLVATSEGKLYSVSPYNGRILGIADIEKDVETAPVLVNETLLITTSDAELTAYK
ncbi:MAG: PQQ-binding-like beta-propeller repeat protein [Alphaproteobacteria bacterium]|nr:PQQ-binding-like beta-propeller repeat protein [Alphaproteobacteria bacterium]